MTVVKEKKSTVEENVDDSVLDRLLRMEEAEKEKGLTRMQEIRKNANISTLSSDEDDDASLDDLETELFD